MSAFPRISGRQVVTALSKAGYKKDRQKGSTEIYRFKNYFNAKRFFLSHAHLIFSVAGFRPGRRGPFVSAKGPKTIDAPSGSWERTDASLRRADQLAPLKQGPPNAKSVPPLGQTAGVGEEKQENGVSCEGCKSTNDLVFFSLAISI